jgi:YidC/Oxa1 family membrane protein insertase
MDRNSIIGLGLIAAILIGFSVYNAPSKEQVEAERRRQDSLTALTQKSQASKSPAAPVAAAAPALTDSARKAGAESLYGPFAPLTQGTEQVVTLENEVLRLKVSSRGGRLIGAELKKYKAQQNKALHLLDRDSSSFCLYLPTGTRTIATDSLYFVPSASGLQLKGQEKGELRFKAEVSPGQYIQWVYRLTGSGYQVDQQLELQGLQQILAPNVDHLDLRWKQKLIAQEKHKAGEQAVSTIYYQFANEEVDYISERKDEQQELPNRVKWVSFKQQYFSTILMAGSGFEKPTSIETKSLADSSRYVKEMSAMLSLPYKHQPSETIALTWYLGPNHYHTLKNCNAGFEEQLNLGWGILGWINRFAVIPIFDFLRGFDLNMGLVILLMTIIIKLVLFPLTYKAYLSSAKMKVLKPEMDEINAKFANEDPLKKQQAIMGLYRKAGVNPLGGCIPMLLQLPILFAMFRFFPVSIELRQAGFLWASDLSSYDSIFTLPFSIPVYGNHVSLFTLLMTASTIIYTRMNSGQFTGNQQMEQMKWIMYLMPIMFMFTLNSYASGLSYYYFIANMLTFSIQYGMKLSIDEQKIHRQIQENKSKPQPARKSRFAQRLEEMAKQQQQLAQQTRQQKGKKK